jgi:Phage integrase, N-terminal SAM-like domain/Phage integrase family
MDYADQSRPAITPGYRSPADRGSKLLDRVREAIRTLHYSIRTEDAYVQWIKRFIVFHGKRHPLEMGAREVEAFLTHLAVEEDVAAATQNQAMSALLFLYKVILERPLEDRIDACRARRPERLPVVLTRAEVRAILDQLDGEKHPMASLQYGSGLRLMECLRLRIKDVDFGQNHLVVHDGKGQKDRVTLLPRSLAAGTNAMLPTGSAGPTCRTPWPRSIPTPIASWPGHTSSPRQGDRSTPGLASSGGTIWPRPLDRNAFAAPSAAPASSSRPLATHSATASPPTCSKPARTSEPCRDSSATRTSARP